MFFCHIFVSSNVILTEDKKNFPVFKALGGDVMNRLFQNEICEKALRDIARGDMSGLTVLYDCFGKLLFTVAYTVIGNRTAAEDVLQDTFIKIAENANTYKHKENGSVKAWGVTISRNLALDFLRRENRTTELFSPPRSADETRRVDDDLAFLEMLSPLDPTDKEIIILKLSFGLKGTEIADILGITPQNVRQKYKRAIDKL